MVRRVHVALLAGLAAFLVGCAGCGATRATTAAEQTPTWCGDRSSIVVLGDTMTTGWGTPGFPGGESYAETPSGWAAGVAELAAEEWGTSTAVFAHNGATAADFLPGGRWPDTRAAVEHVRDLRPSLVVIALGAAEYARDVEPVVFDERYRALVDAIQAASPRSTILPVLQYEPGARRAEDPVHSWDTYTDVIETVAADEGTELLDLGEHLPEAGTPEAEGLFLPDRVHLTPAGHRVVRAAIWTFLSTWCGTDES